MPRSLSRDARRVWRRIAPALHAEGALTPSNSDLLATYCDLLVQLGSALRGATRAVDVCARLGGDEFAVLLPETEAASVDAVLDRVRLVLAEAAVETESPVTVSMGAATFARPPANVDEMLRVADRMLYEVKAAGRNDVRHERVG